MVTAENDCPYLGKVHGFREHELLVVMLYPEFYRGHRLAGYLLPLVVPSVSLHNMDVAII